MSCLRLTSPDGAIVGWVCGVSGSYTHLVKARCPWCCVATARTIHGVRLVSDGWVAPDMACGRCGQYWTYDDDRTFTRRTSKVEQRENRAAVKLLKLKGKKAGRMPRPRGAHEAKPHLDVVTKP